MMTLRGKDWLIYPALLLIASVLVYQGRHYIMQIHYNPFLLGLLVMAFLLVLLAWRVGKSPDPRDPPEPGGTRAGTR